MTEPIKLAIIAAPLVPPVLGLATGDTLATKTNLVPYNPVTLPLWAWFAVAGYGSFLLWKHFK